MVKIIKDNRKTVIVEVTHKYRSGDGAIHEGKAQIKIHKDWLAQAGQTVEEAAKEHVATKIVNFHSF